jgi:hypothetical protein
VKLKRQATAAFLGVFSFPKDVVGVCCIPTTIFGWIPHPRGGFDGSNGPNRNGSGINHGSTAGWPDRLLPQCDSDQTKKAAADAAAFECNPDDLAGPRRARPLRLISVRRLVMAQPAAMAADLNRAA